MLIRQASRLLLIDEARRILLFKYEDDRGTWWATPGGGLEQSESFEQAARREAEEELGLATFSLEQLWERTAEFRSRGETIRQTERYFLIHTRIADIRLGEDVREAHVLEGILTAKWWLPGELTATTERIFPEDLLLRLHGLWERRHDVGAKR